ncbi:MAG: hypothetical protein ACTSQU_06020 [Promethearchaeota archaeon]
MHIVKKLIDRMLFTVIIVGGRSEMTLSFQYDFIIGSILMSVLWIIRDATLVLWTQTLKTREPKLKYINFLRITGITLLAWSIVSVFLPRASLSFIHEESELLFYNLFNFVLHDLIPIILGVFLGVAFSLYFYNLYYKINKRVFLKPGLFLIGYILLLFVEIIFYPLIILDYSVTVVTFRVYFIGLALTNSIQLVGISFIFIYAIHINNEFLITFCGLFFAYLMLSLVNNINSLIIIFTSFQ